MTQLSTIMKPCECKKCAHYIIQKNSCMKGYVTRKTYYPDGCDQYKERTTREILIEVYEQRCHKCARSIMCDMVIWGIPYCTVKVCDFVPRVV